MISLVFIIVLASWEKPVMGERADVNPPSVQIIGNPVMNETALNGSHGIDVLSKRVKKLWSKLVNSVFSKCLESLPETSPKGLKFAYFINVDVKSYISYAFNKISITRLIYTEADIDHDPNIFYYSGVSIFVLPPSRKILKKIEHVRFSSYVVYDKCDRLSKIFYKFWNNFHINNVLGLCVRKSKEVLFYTMNVDDQCRMLGINLIDVWKENSKSLKMNHFLSKEMNWLNFRKCTVEVGLFIREQAAFLDHGEIMGWEPKVLNVVIKKLNGVPRFKLYEDGFSYESMSEVSDIVGGMLLTSLPHDDEYGFWTGVEASTCWVVPRWKRKVPNLSFITSIFQIYVWLLFLLVLIAHTLLLCMAFRRHFRWSKAFIQAMNVTHSLVLHNTLTKKELKRTGKPYILMMLFFIFLMATSFQAKLGSKLIAGNTKVDLLDLQDIIDSDLNIICREKVHRFIFTNWLQYEPKLKPLANRVIVVPQNTSIDDILRKVAEDKNVAFFDILELVEYHLPLLDYETISSLYIQTQTLESFPCYFFAHKYSWVLPGIIKVYSYAVEAGFATVIKNYFSLENQIKVETMKYAHTKEVQPFTIQDISDAFLCLLIGLSISIYVFLFENFITWMTSKSNKLPLKCMIVIFMAMTSFLLAFKFFINEHFEIKFPE